LDHAKDNGEIRKRSYRYCPAQGHFYAHYYSQRKSLLDKRLCRRQGNNSGVLAQLQPLPRSYDSLNATEPRGCHADSLCLQALQREYAMLRRGGGSLLFFLVVSSFLPVTTPYHETVAQGWLPLRIFNRHSFLKGFFSSPSSFQKSFCLLLAQNAWWARQSHNNTESLVPISLIPSPSKVSEPAVVGLVRVCSTSRKYPSLLTKNCSLQLGMVCYGKLWAWFRALQPKVLAGRP
jgi:hypothetical protein